jgi:transposase
MSTPKFTFAQFKTRFPNDDACLKHIFEKRFAALEACPKCELEAKFHQCSGTRYYACQHCGHHIHPTVGTIFENSRTPLVSWLYAMFLFATARNGVSAKELQRQLGVTYKCAFRMGHLIRSLMDETGEVTLTGKIEIDESLFGAKHQRGGKHGWGAMETKPCVFGMVERGGKVITKVVEKRDRKTLFPIITANTKDDVTAYTDDFKGYRTLKKEVGQHFIIQHSKKAGKERKHVDGENGHIHTQTIDGHWSILKRSIRGTHTSVSKKYLQRYLNEFSFRRNHKGLVMFDEILGRL